MDGAANFFVAADDRVQFSGARLFGQVDGEFFEGVVAAFGGVAVRFFALAVFAHRRSQAGGVDAVVVQELFCFFVLFGHGDEQRVGGDVRVSGRVGVFV